MSEPGRQQGGQLSDCRDRPRPCKNADAHRLGAINFYVRGPGLSKLDYPYTKEGNDRIIFRDPGTAPRFYTASTQSGLSRARSKRPRLADNGHAAFGCSGAMSRCSTAANIQVGSPDGARPPYRDGCPRPKWARKAPGWLDAAKQEQVPVSRETPLYGMVQPHAGIGLCVSGVGL